LKTLAQFLKESRETKGWRIYQVAQAIGIDAALIGKYEKGTRLPPEKQLPSLAQALGCSVEELQKLWLAEKVVRILNDYHHAEEVLTLAESRVSYLSTQKQNAEAALPQELQDQLREIDLLQGEWHAKKPLNQTQLLKMRDYFNIAYTYESNRIEGNTLTLQETELVVRQGITIGGKPMVEHLEAINHAEALEWVEDMAREGKPINSRAVLDIHALILRNIDRDNAGRYRKVPVRIAGSRHKPPQPYMLDKLMEDYFQYYERMATVVHPVILAAEMHERLVTIHPFVDGNGRTSRLVMNLILLSAGYTIANLKGDNQSRLRYFQALEAVQVHNEPEHFYRLVAQQVKDSLEAHLALCG